MAPHASTQAFGTAELLESILLHLEMRDLLQTQRVSRYWKDVIQSSPQIQRKMFLGFVPSTGDRSRFVIDNTSSKKVETSELEASKAEIESRPQTEAKPLETDPGSQNEESKPVISFNPVFPSQGQVMRMRTRQFRDSLDSGHSWLDMYLTQPPTSCARALLYFTERKFRFFLTRRYQTRAMSLEIQRPEGLRARDVLKELRGCDCEEVRKWQRMDILIPEVIRR